MLTPKPKRAQTCSIFPNRVVLICRKLCYCSFLRINDLVVFVISSLVVFFDLVWVRACLSWLLVFRRINACTSYMPDAGLLTVSKPCLYKCGRGEDHPSRKIFWDDEAHNLLILD